MRRRDDRVGREPVHLGIVEQKEEGAEAADAVFGVAAVQLRAVPSFVLELCEPIVRACAQLLERAELDRLRRAGLRARRLVTALQPVVAERALPHAPVLLREGRQVGSRCELPLVEHAERARGDAGPTAVADVLLHDDGAELRAEERSGRADIEAGRVRAVLAHVRLHEPAKPDAAVAVRAQRLLLLDERDVPPRVRVQLAGVVVGVACPHLAVLRDEVPLLARDLARLAADAYGRVGEEADARLLVVAPRLVTRGRAGRPHDRAHDVFLTSSGSTRGSCSRRDSAWSRISATNSTSFLPRGRRPGRMPHVAALVSMMWTFGSSAACRRSFAESPDVSRR